MECDDVGKAWSSWRSSGNMQYWRSPRFVADLLTAGLGMISLIVGAVGLPCPWKYIVSGLSGAFLLAFVLVRRSAEIVQSKTDREAAEREADRDREIEGIRAEAKANAEANETYFRELLRRSHLDELERRAFGLATNLSAIIDEFLKGMFPLNNKLHMLNALSSHPAALSKLDFTQQSVSHEIARLERNAMRKYREGNYEALLREIVNGFGERGIHDEYTDAFEKVGAREPYRVKDFRDALYRLAAESSAMH